MPRPQLLSTTHWLLKAAAWVSLILAALMVAALVAVAVAALNPQLGIPPDQVLFGIPRPQLLGWAAIPIAGGLACFVLVALAFRTAGTIVATARSGDPWDPLESTCRHASLSIL